MSWLNLPASSRFDSCWHSTTNPSGQTRALREAPSLGSLNIPRSPGQFNQALRKWNMINMYFIVYVIYIYLYKLLLTITYKLTLALRQILLKLIRLNPINSCTSLPVWTEAEIWSQKSYKNHLKSSCPTQKVRTQPIESDLRCVGASGTPRLMPTAFAAKACRWTSRASATWCRRLQFAP